MTLPRLVPSSCSTSNPQQIQINVKPQSTTGKNMAINIKPTVTVRNHHLKELLFLKEDIPPVYQRLIYAGKQLPDDGWDDGQTLQDFGIVKERNLQLLIRLRGGGSSETGPNVWRSCRSILSLLICLTSDIITISFTRAINYLISTGVESSTSDRADGFGDLLRLESVRQVVHDDVWLKGNQSKRLHPNISVDGECGRMAGKLPRNFLPQWTVHRPWGFQSCQVQTIQKRIQHLLDSGYRLRIEIRRMRNLQWEDLKVSHSESHISRPFDQNQQLSYSWRWILDIGQRAGRPRVSTPFAFVNASTNSLVEGN